jgi:hypothetical protein
MKQQSSVESLFYKMFQSFELFESKKLTYQEYVKEILQHKEKAKAMHKQEIKEAREDGHISTYTEYDSDTKLYLEGRHEHYYNETYGGDK